jgi:hypothetical protein
MLGKAPTLHRMGVMDAPSAGFGRPRDVDAELAAGRFALAILDYKVQWYEWPTLYGGMGRYHIVDQLHAGVDAPRTFSGADTAPRYVLAPRPAGAIAAWEPAFSSTISGTARIWHDLVITHRKLVFDVVGDTDERGCHVDLIVDDKPVRTVTGPGRGGLTRVSWDLADLAGRAARIELVDETETGRLGVDELWWLD